MAFRDVLIIRIHHCNRSYLRIRVLNVGHFKGICFTRYIHTRHNQYGLRGVEPKCRCYHFPMYNRRLLY